MTRNMIIIIYKEVFYLLNDNRYSRYRYIRIYILIFIHLYSFYINDTVYYNLKYIIFYNSQKEIKYIDYYWYYWLNNTSSVQYNILECIHYNICLYKILGILFDSKLNWLHLLKYIRDSISKILNIIKIIAHTSWGGDSASL